MKKVFLSTLMMLALAISFTSCKDAADKAKEGMEDAADATGEAMDEAGDAAGEAMDEASDAISDMTDGVPSFENPAVTEYVEAYDSYIEEYKAAAESKDMTAISNLGTKGQELATKSQEIMSGLSASDASKLTEYMTAKAKEMQEISKKMME
ncbi:DUF4175 domain-containing protein [Aggregatimonas sangjinii]|uniref:DUF4175 domain-containing protein n=1 Tax=Aggregatimonas sangjinii TaxID=2583587 RepID=A0A5B7SYG2_9FLAO|nr:DUF4175 domain-containing protein [Aggregatimonas sangjinii]QCX02118.1 DUF4175 domain-containing protein [Aggregatimonas sangjinii]